MDYKAPPQYATPGQNGTPAPQYSSPQPQYGQPVPLQQQYAQVPLPQAQQPPQLAYGQPMPQQHGVVQYGAPQHPQPVQNVQHAQQYIQPQHPAAQPGQPGQPGQLGQPGQPGQPAQYQTQAPMQRAVVAPVAKGGDWSSSLMDCSPCDSCLLATFLPCILIGQTADRMRDPSMASADTLNSECLVFTAIQCITGCGWIYVMMKRSEIRERYGIQGGGTSDCCATYWCACCALIQQDKEVKVRTSSAAGLVTQGYQAQAGMQMPQMPQMPQMQK